MTPELKTAIDELTQVIDGQLREVAELKRSVNKLCLKAGLEPLYLETDPTQDADRRVTLHGDTYYGRPLATAMREHLEAQRHGLPLPALLTAMEQGGFDFDAIEWAPENRLRNLAISVSKNPLFKRLPSGVVGLKSWYGDSAKEPSGQKAGKKRTTGLKGRHKRQEATKASAKPTSSNKSAETPAVRNGTKARAAATAKDQSSAKKGAAKAEKVASSGHAQSEHVH